MNTHESLFFFLEELINILVQHMLRLTMMWRISDTTVHCTYWLLFMLQALKTQWVAEIYIKLLNEIYRDLKAWIITDVERDNILKSKME